MAKWYRSVEKWECLSNCTYRSNSVDGRIVCFHFTHQITSFSWPQFDVSGPATGNDRMASRKEAKAAYPIFVGVIQGFDDLKTEKKSVKIFQKFFENNQLLSFKGKNHVDQNSCEPQSKYLVLHSNLRVCAALKKVFSCFRGQKIFKKKSL